MPLSWIEAGVVDNVELDLRVGKRPEDRVGHGKILVQQMRVQPAARQKLPFHRSIAVEHKLVRGMLCPVRYRGFDDFGRAG